MRNNQPARPPIPWPEGPTFTGHTYQITDVESFFLPVLNGQAPPPESYQPWSGLEVRTWSVNDLLPIPVAGPSSQTQADGSFSITQPPANAKCPVGRPRTSGWRWSFQKDHSRSVRSTGPTLA
jgi:hypothetical protein